MTLDHLIAVVPVIRATHRRLLDAGFEEAWPPGPFWPSAVTSGIALGGANLELVQPDEGVTAAKIETIVLAPATLDEGYRMLRETGYDYNSADKVEGNPQLLALRGFPPEMCAEPQLICNNLYPLEGEADYPFFLCHYAPFLKERLAPGRFRFPRGPITALALTAPAPEAVRRLFSGHLGPIELDVETGATAEVLEIRFTDGSSLAARDL